MPLTNNDLTFQLLSALGEGVYGVDIKGNCTFINPSALSMLGYERDEVIGKDQHALFHHQKPDGEDYHHQDCPIFKTLQTGIRHQVNETFIHKGGRYIPIRLTVTPIQSIEGITGAVVAFSDISELVNAQREIQAERDLFAEGPVSVIVWELNNDWPIHYASANVAQLFGYTASDMMHTSFRYRDSIHPEDRARVSQEVNHFLLDNRNKWQQNYRILHSDGSVRYLHDYTITERDATGKVIKLHGYLIDETPQKKLEQQLTRMATTDELTDLYNRRHLMTLLDVECNRFKRMGNHISLLMLDLDHFKHINDTWGHAAGDMVLIQFSKILKTIARKSDHIGRLGGEEFVIVLPETNEEGAKILAEKIRFLASASPVSFKDKPISYTVSIGIASCCDRTRENEDNMLQKADQALYQAKSEGRNRVVTLNVCSHKMALDTI